MKLIFKQRRKSGNQPLVVRYSPFSSLLDSNENIIVLLRSLSTWPWQVKSLHKLEMDAWLDLASIYTKLEAWHDSNICLDKARSIDFFYPKYWHVRGKYSQLPDLILVIYSVMLSFYQTNKELKINYCNFFPCCDWLWLHLLQFSCPLDIKKMGLSLKLNNTVLLYRCFWIDI